MRATSQLLELFNTAYSDVYLNSPLIPNIGTTKDGGCNLGDSCKSCTDSTTSFKNKLVYLNKQSNKLSLRAYDSHALRKVSTSCNLVKPECVPEKEICDGKDNDCDGNLDEGCDNDLDYFFDWNMECKDNFYSWDFNIAGFNYSKGWHYLEQYNGWAYMGDDLSWLLRLFECGKKDCNDNDYSINPGWAWEKCNNIDDNCNGLIDENLFRNTNQLGLCSKNKQQCILGEWENLGTNYLPRQEICNFLDDDCDGLIDEGLNCNKGCNLNSDCSHLNNQTFYCFNNDEIGRVHV